MCKVWSQADKNVAINASLDQFGWAVKDNTFRVFLGNEYSHQITSKGSYKLKVRLTHYIGGTRYVLYYTFFVAGEEIIDKLYVEKT